jgi:predicted membrane protein
MGGVVLDLREALLTTPEVTIKASTFMGSVDVIVDEHTVVVCDGHAFMGDYSEKRSRVRSEPQSGSPVVRVQGLALMGRVNVKRRPGPEQR